MTNQAGQESVGPPSLQTSIYQRCCSRWSEIELDDREKSMLPWRTHTQTHTNTHIVMRQRLFAARKQRGESLQL